jgi:hypothetical protein
VKINDFLRVKTFVTERTKLYEMPGERSVNCVNDETCILNIPTIAVLGHSLFYDVLNIGT